MNSLVVGFALIAIDALLFLVVYRGTRKENAGGLFSDAWVANIHTPLMIALATFGSGHLVKFALVSIH